MGTPNDVYQKQMRDKSADFQRAIHGQQPRDPISPSQTYKNTRILLGQTDNNHFKIDPKASEALGEAIGQLIVIIIVGLYKTGKFLFKAAVIPMAIMFGTGIKNGAKHTGELTRKSYNRIKALPKKIKYGVPSGLAAASLASFFTYGLFETNLGSSDLLSRMKDRFTEAVGIDYKFTHVVTANAAPVMRENTDTVKAAYKVGDCVVVRYNYDDTGLGRIVQMGLSGQFNYSMINNTDIRPLADGETCPNKVTDQPSYTTLSDLQKLRLVR